TNNGSSWTSVNNGLTSSYVYSFAVSGANIFAGTDGGGVFLSTNNGSSWTSVNNGLTNSYVLSLAVSGTNIFAGTWSDGVFLSTNNGLSWTAVNNGLTYYNVSSLAVSGTNIFAGTNGGVFLSTNNGSNWLNKNQGFKVITSVEALLIANNYIFAGTVRQSVWKRPLSDFNILYPPTNLVYHNIDNRLTWTLSPSTNVAKYLVYKKGSDNIWKSVADSGGMVSSTQNYYDIQTSGFNYYKVAAISTVGDTAKSDSVYVNRGYVLRKWNTDTIESFKVKKHGFRFGNEETINGEPILWNSSWYSQFYYSYPPYPLYFFFYKPSDYPDWPLFTNVYGRNKCYEYYFKPGNVLDSSFLRKSVTKWRGIVYNPVSSRWRGACFGMAASSLLAFYKNASFYNQFPIINNVDSIYGLSPSNEISKMVNWLHQTQYFEGTTGRYSFPVDTIGQNPITVLNNLESRLSKVSTSGKLNEILAIYYNLGGGHAVVPYAIEKINESIKYLYIYDNECPGIDTARLIINTTSNSCIYNMNNRQIIRVFLVGSLESFLGEQTFDKSVQKFYSDKKMLNDTILFFNSIYNSSLYLNQNGDTISGYRISDSSFVGNKDLGYSPMTDGRLNPPILYKIPFANYLRVVFKDFISPKQSSFLSFDMDSTTTYKIERIDSSQSNQNDIYSIDNGYFSFVNINPVQKKLNLLTIITENLLTKKEKTFNIEQFKMMNNDTVLIKKNNDNLIIKSVGSSKTYTLNLNFVDTTGNKSFYNPSVFMATNSTHIISPVWDSIKTKPVKIFVDLGNNGTIDDTLLIIDTIWTNIKKTNIEIPDKFTLYQNFPNPFNSVTKIAFDIPKATQVSLKIYDILGREMECLINEYVQPGKYNYDFNANKYSSGVYFYRL
ncbi:MAG TPA: T9SS type A sorting domain-containing protein, partial [Ignavibacteria bacterium]